jgi:Tol biopolymer transport system component/lysophospholipase L1-like esterase
MPGRRPIVHLLALALATTLAVNPVVLRLLTGRTAFSVAASILAVALVVGLAAKRQRTTVAALVFNALVLVGLALHAELVLRVAFPDLVVPNLYAIRDGYYANEPLLAQRFATAEYSASYYTNVQGFRIAPEQNAYEQVTAADWLVIGDSFTQGAQVDFAEMFTSRLYRRFPDRVVVNAGTSGLGLGQEFNYFEREGRALKPTLVVLVLGSFNDFMNVRAPQAGAREHLMAASALARLLFTPTEDGEHLPLGRWTEPFQPTLQGNIDYNVFFRETSQQKLEDLRAFEEHLEAFAGAVKEGGGRLLVALLPTREQVDPRALEAVRSAYKISADAVDMRAPNRLADHLTRRLGVGFVDLLPAFLVAGDGLFFEQDVHLTSRGHEVVAQALGDYLESTEGPSPVRLLSQGPAPERYPSFAPDGRQLVFQTVRGGASDLRIAGADLSHARWLTATGVDEAHPSLSRDASSVVFTAGPAETMRTDVVLMDIVASTRSVLTPGDTLFGAIPSFSRTGRQVAFAEWTYDQTAKGFTQPRIVVLELASGKKTYLTSGEHEAWRPVFSPTDTEVAFIERAGGQIDVHVFDLTTGTRSRLTDTPYDEWDPQFAPDGRTIVYAARADGNWDLFKIDIATREVTRITQTRGDEWDPVISPDGRRLLYGARFGSFEGILEQGFAGITLSSEGGRHETRSATGAKTGR